MKKAEEKKLILEEDIAVHIFTVSAGMIGVCLTVIGIIQVIIERSRIQTLADDMLGVANLFFITSCILSYIALRTRRHKRMFRIEKTSDMIFLAGLCIMAIVSLLIAYTQI